jgi:hypothetical protein
MIAIYAIPISFVHSIAKFFLGICFWEAKWLSLIKRCKNNGDHPHEDLAKSNY